MSKIAKFWRQKWLNLCKIYGDKIQVPLTWNCLLFYFLSL